MDASSSFSQSSSNGPTSPQFTPIPQTPPLSWNEAFSKACFSRNTVTISLHQVLQDFPTIKWEQLPLDMVFEADNQLQEKIVQDYRKSRGTVPSSSTTPSQQQQQSSTLYRIASTTASVTATVLLSPVKLMLNRLLALESEDDAYYYNQQQQTETSVYTLEQNQKRAELLSASNKKMINLELVVSLLQWLDQVVSKSTTTSTTSRGVAVSLEGAGPWSLHGWILKQAGEETASDKGGNLAPFFTNLPAAQIRLLLECMTQITNGSVKIVHRRPAHCDLVLLGGATINAAEGATTDNETIMIHYFDLCRAVENSEKRIADLSRRVQELEENAIQFKRQSNNKGGMKRALYEMQRRKLYSTQLDKLYTTLLHLEQTKNAIELAETNQMILSTLSQSAATLKLLRQSSSSVEEVDNVMLDLTEELEHLDMVNDAIQQELNTHSISNIDSDNELLEELANLSLERDNESFVPIPAAAVPSTTMQDVSKLKSTENEGQSTAPPEAVAIG